MRTSPVSTLVSVTATPATRVRRIDNCSLQGIGDGLPKHADAARSKCWICAAARDLVPNVHVVEWGHRQPLEREECP
jgi:hypothetical protein